MGSILIAVICGAVVGLCLGALGGGGGILVWPALIFGMGVGAEEASLLAKIVVGSCAAFAALLHWRHGTVRPGVGLVMATVGAGGAWLGGNFIRLTGMDGPTTERVMLTVLALLMVVVATLMLRKGLTLRSSENADEPTRVPPQLAPIPRWTGFILASSWVGFITGFLGVGGGFMIVPTLVLVFRMPMLIAAGTSLIVISLNCASGIAASLPGVAIRWDIAIPFAGTAIAASIFSVRFANRARQSSLQIGFAGLIIVLGGMMLWTAV